VSEKLNAALSPPAKEELCSFALRIGQEQQRLTDDLQQVHECQRS